MTPNTLVIWGLFGSLDGFIDSRSGEVPAWRFIGLLDDFIGYVNNELQWIRGENFSSAH